MILTGLQEEEEEDSEGIRIGIIGRRGLQVGCHIGRVCPEPGLFFFKDSTNTSSSEYARQGRPWNGIYDSFQAK